MADNLNQVTGGFDEAVAPEGINILGRVPAREEEFIDPDTGRVIDPELARALAGGAMVDQSTDLVSADPVGAPEGLGGAAGGSQIGFNQALANIPTHTQSQQRTSSTSRQLDSPAQAQARQMLAEAQQRQVEEGEATLERARTTGEAQAVQAAAFNQANEAASADFENSETRRANIIEEQRMKTDKVAEDHQAKLGSMEMNGRQKYWSGKSVWAKLASALATGAGAWAATISGGRNFALDIVESAIADEEAAIERDIAAGEVVVSDSRRALQDLIAATGNESAGKARWRRMIRQDQATALELQMAGTTNEKALAAQSETLMALHAKNAQDDLLVEQNLDGQSQVQMSITNSALSPAERMRAAQAQVQATMVRDTLEANLSEGGRGRIERMAKFDASAAGMVDALATLRDQAAGTGVIGRAISKERIKGGIVQLLTSDSAFEKEDEMVQNRMMIQAMVKKHYSGTAVSETEAAKLAEMAADSIGGTSKQIDNFAKMMARMNAVASRSMQAGMSRPERAAYVARQKQIQSSEGL